MSSVTLSVLWSCNGGIALERLRLPNHWQSFAYSQSDGALVSGVPDIPESWWGRGVEGTRRGGAGCFSYYEVSRLHFGLASAALLDRLRAEGRVVRSRFNRHHVTRQIDGRWVKDAAFNVVTQTNDRGPVPA